MNPTLGDCCKPLAEGIFLPLPLLKGIDLSLEGIVTLTWGDCHPHLRRLLETLTWGDTPSLEVMGTCLHSRGILKNVLPSHHLREWHLSHIARSYQNPLTLTHTSPHLLRKPGKPLLKAKIIHTVLIVKASAQRWAILWEQARTSLVDFSLSSLSGVEVTSAM